MTDVFSVHTAKPDEIGAVEIVFLFEQDARGYAIDRSRDHRVVSTSVTRFVVGQLGTRSSVAWFKSWARGRGWSDQWARNSARGGGGGAAPAS